MEDRAIEDPAAGDPAVEDLADAARARGEVDGGTAPDPVNAPMVRHWLQAMGHTGTRFLDEGLAPPAMLQVWTMPGPGGGPRPSAVDTVLAGLDARGYTGVVATDCTQTYDRPLRMGETPRAATRFASLRGPKATAMGEGYFLTWETTWYCGGERVGAMTFRVLKFDPATRPGPRTGDGRPAAPPPPPRNDDTAFFWDGAAAGELRIRRCADCGTLRHPPGPLCPACRSAAADHVVARGEGTVHSYTVHHHPPVPGHTAPFAVALVDLPEGVRVVGGVTGADPADVHVGMPVRADFARVGEGTAPPRWRPADQVPLPALELELTRSSITAQALATRDFTPVHHDPDRARAQGARDVFLNILTTQGLVQRYADTHRPGARVRGIAVRLGAPAHAGDTLVLTGTAHPRGGRVEVRGTTSMGPHVTATVELDTVDREDR
ncbi:OB-fold domain-containing protein [Nocardiopsis chromatogenes]|uniref:OB-fold domain-containing protein n=1 Tax=Nocardiopsis chromatogenes TaxID=280239 RepID=UPI00034CD748|nr:OB-fold domain-containing protein [Nocardiopsis chromatogenes]